MRFMIWQSNKKDKEYLFKTFVFYIRIQPPFSSGGGLFAFSIVAIKESKVLAISKKVKSELNVSLFSTYKHSRHASQKFRQKDSSIVVLVLNLPALTPVFEYLNQTCYQQ